MKTNPKVESYRQKLAYAQAEYDESKRKVSQAQRELMAARQVLALAKAACDAAVEVIEGGNQ